MSFDAAFSDVVLIEGGYSDNPLDSGGKTKYGITEGVARANGYTGDMRALPLETARAIYKAQYWDLLRLDSVDALSPIISHKMFDIAVNGGIATAGKFLQRALNVLNRQQTDFPDVVVDGLVGPGTLYALTRFKALRGDAGMAVLSKALNAQGGVRYIEIAEAVPKDEAFEFGWLVKRVA
jgi:lysozyme family protein